MADIFTSTPVPVLAVNPLISGTGLYSSKKLFKVGTDRYVLGVEEFPAGVDRQIIAVKSTDGGATWSGVLGTTPGGFTPGGECMVLDTANNKIHIVAKKAAPPNHLFYFFFDLLTDSYSVPVDSGQPAGNMVAALQSTGDLYVVFDGANTGDAMQIATVSAGAWGGFTTLVSGSADIFLLPVGILVDASDDAHILYQQNNVAPTYIPTRIRLYYTTLISGVPGSPALVEDLGVAAQNYTMGPGLLWSDHLLFANYSLNTETPHKVRLWVGTPVAAPVWTKLDVAVLVGSNFTDFGPDLLLVGSEPWILWTDVKLTAPFTAQINAACYNGTAIGAQHTAWDTYTNVVPGSESIPDGQRDVFFNSAIISAGRAGELIAWTEIDSDVFDESYCFLTGTFPSCVAGSPMVVCDNPPVGKINVLYSHTFPAAGGTPPYTFSISAGALPPGLSLDSSTGVVSGTPTESGAFVFTVLVTDEADATGDVECSILIKQCLLVDLRS